MFYLEWAQAPKFRKGYMIAEPHIQNIIKSGNPGYSSVYLFSAEDAQEIKRNGHSRGLQKYTVTARQLILDIDTLAPEVYKAVYTRLKDRGYSFQVWASGGKGYHFYIPHAEITSPHLPNSHMMVAKDLAPESDMTLYQHGRLISLPGRVHPVSKKRKQLLDEVEGTQELVIPLVEPEVRRIDFESSPESDAELLEIALKRVVMLIGNQPENGKRHIRLWGVARDMALCGIAYETALDILTQVNETWTDQKSDLELRAAVSKAYQIG